MRSNNQNHHRPVAWCPLLLLWFSVVETSPLVTGFTASTTLFRSTAQQRRPWNFWRTDKNNHNNHNHHNLLWRRIERSSVTHLSSTLQPPSHQNHNRRNHSSNHNHNNTTDTYHPLFVADLSIVPASVVLTSASSSSSSQQAHSYDSCLFTYSCPRRRMQQQQQQPPASIASTRTPNSPPLFVVATDQQKTTSPPTFQNKKTTKRTMRIHSLLALVCASVASASSSRSTAVPSSKLPGFSGHPKKGGYIQRQQVTIPTTNSASSDMSKTSRHAPTIRLASPQKAVKWACLLTALSGYCNGVFMSGFLQLLPKQGVAAVTGAWTQSAMGAASNQVKLFVGQSAVIVSFMLGSLLYGLINPSPKQLELERRPTSTALGLVGACLVGALYILDHATSKDRAAAFEVCCLVAVASGLQNSLTSSLTGNLCRTTHYTGISSDMGTFLGQVLRGNTANVFKLQTFAKLAACFWLGGYGAFFAAQRWGADALRLPVAVTVGLALYTQFVHRA
mmetsp:Transcript_4420/g.12257  ORF Transcript_4420/g.12257 Transcript_4420/m.12257 type:complete len:505 (-) Transcript_4420:157-1671(-)